MDQMIADTIRGITELVTVPSLMNIDFADLRAVFKGKGIAVLLAGESEEGIHNKNESVTRSSLAHSSNNLDIKGATGCLICITGDSDIDRFYGDDIATAISYTLDPHADVVWGLNEKKEMAGKTRVFAIVTGFKEGADAIFSESKCDLGG